MERFTENPLQIITVLREFNDVTLDFLAKPNAEKLILGLKRHQDIIRPGTLRFESLEEMQRIYLMNDWHDGNVDPEEHARETWFHETAHQEVLRRWGITDCPIRMVLPITLRTIRVYWAYVDVNIEQLRAVVKGDSQRLAQILADTSLAPQRQNFYPTTSETKVGILCLGVACGIDMSNIIEKLKAETAVHT